MHKSLKEKNLPMIHQNYQSLTLVSHLLFDSIMGFQDLLLMQVLNDVTIEKLENAIHQKKEILLGHL